MSMVECFFSNKYAGRSDLFEGLSIWSDSRSEGNSFSGEGFSLEGNSSSGEDSPPEGNSPSGGKFFIGKYNYRELQGTFPVIFLTFANIKAGNYADMEYKISEVIAALYEKNRYLLEGELLSENERAYYKSIKVGIEDMVVAGAVHKMSDFMQRYYGKQVIILLDEYDTLSKKVFSQE